MDPRLKSALAKVQGKRFVFLTGAGISAESGIPTFRGEQGYWTVGSQNYRPEELATRAAFGEMPEEIWSWYLYRRSECNRAKPNPGHEILAKWEEKFQDKFLLVTQNVDGLHLRAGNSQERTYQVHGNTNFMRCWQDCTRETYLIPEDIGEFERGQEFTAHHRERLVCPKCGGLARPHVLWFDECYDEEIFRFQSSIQAAFSCGALISIGSSGSTNLPTQMVRGAAGRGALSIDINVQRGPYSMVAQSSGGFWLKGTATEGLQQLAQCLSW